jgi:hypothetical protein
VKTFPSFSLLVSRTGISDWLRQVASDATELADERTRETCHGSSLRVSAGCADTGGRVICPRCGNPVRASCKGRVATIREHRP